MDKAEIVKIASEVGAKVALERFDRQLQQAKTSRYERRLRNTRLLLKNYHMFKQHVSGAVFDETQLDGENAIDVLDLVFENSSKELQIQSIKHSAMRTALIVRHIDEMLRFYEIYCETSCREEDRRRYRVVKARYVDDPPMSLKNIACSEHIDQRTAERDVQAACQALSALIFGIDGVEQE